MFGIYIIRTFSPLNRWGVYRHHEGIFYIVDGSHSWVGR